MTIDFCSAFVFFFFFFNLLYSALHLGFPNEPAAVIALSTAKEWLSKNHHEVGKTTQSGNIQDGVISALIWKKKTDKSIL